MLLQQMSFNKLTNATTVAFLRTLVNSRVICEMVVSETERIIHLRFSGLPNEKVAVEIENDLITVLPLEGSGEGRKQYTYPQAAVDFILENIHEFMTRQFRHLAARMGIDVDKVSFKPQPKLE